MKALVISGGGSKGAFAGGVAEYLTLKQKQHYEIYAGSSVGALVVSQVALHKLKELKIVFESISNKDVFNIFPFRVKKRRDKVHLAINHINTIKAFIKGSASFGESKNLRKLIQKMLTKNEFETILKNTDLIIAVSNLTKHKVEYIEAKQCSYEDFCDWIWASANVAPFMSLLTKNNCQYADGGFGIYLPVLRAIELGATDVDAIILNKQDKNNIDFYHNPFQTLMGVFQFMSNQIEIKDLLIGKMKGKQSQIDIRLWFPPVELTQHSIYFDAAQMKKWWQMGYELAKVNRPLCYCFLPDGKIIPMN